MSNPTLNDHSRQFLDTMRKHMVDDMREALLENGPRREGLVPSANEIALCQSLAEVCFTALAHRIKPIQAECAIHMAEAKPGETTQAIIDRKVKPEICADAAKALIEDDLITIALFANEIGTKVVFQAIGVALDTRETLIRETAEEAKRREIRSRLILPPGMQ